jgi:mttA/Hcf106 family
MLGQNLFGIGYQEFIIVLIVIFILFGHRLPSVMRELGRPLLRGPWETEATRFRHDPNKLWPTSLADWLGIWILAGSLIALLWLAIAWSN